MIIEVLRKCHHCHGEIKMESRGSGTWHDCPVCNKTGKTWQQMKVFGLRTIEEEESEPAKTGRGVEVPSKPMSTRPLRKGVNMREGPVTIEVEVCVGCKWLRLDLAFDRQIRGKCIHPASPNGPQFIGHEDTILPSPFETPSWCRHKMIEANLKSLRDELG